MTTTLIPLKKLGSMALERKNLVIKSSSLYAGHKHDFGNTNPLPNKPNGHFVDRILINRGGAKGGGGGGSQGQSPNDFAFFCLLASSEVSHVWIRWWSNNIPIYTPIMIILPQLFLSRRRNCPSSSPPPPPPPTKKPWRRPWLYQCCFEWDHANCG